MSSAESKLGFQGAWSMAVGGMVGGGIFSTLGVVVGTAGAWAWGSFVAAGLVALAAGHAYVSLAARYGEGGGAFTFLREEGAEGFAGSLSWVLIVGYVLTNAVYAFTFGEYLGHVIGGAAWVPRVAAVAIVAVFIGLNLRGVGEAGGVEIFMVWFKLAVLVGLAGFGLWQWNPEALSRGVPDGGPLGALYGAAMVFMAYEGFQLLSYDYDDIREPDRTLPRVVLSSIVVVIAVYVAVALGVTMLVGADEVVEQQEVVLSIAGQKALGTAGLIIVTIAAALSTGSAINSTLFSTARLADEVARDGELPKAVEHHNAADVPDRAIITLGVLSAALAAIGSLAQLVEGASLVFLFTFATVCALAWHRRAGHRVVTGAGALMASAALVALLVHLVRDEPWALLGLVVVLPVAIVGRPIILRHVAVDGADDR